MIAPSIRTTLPALAPSGRDSYDRLVVACQSGAFEPRAHIGLFLRAGDGPMRIQVERLDGTVRADALVEVAREAADLHINPANARAVHSVMSVVLGAWRSAERWQRGLTTRVTVEHTHRGPEVRARRRHPTIAVVTAADARAQRREDRRRKRERRQAKRMRVAAERRLLEAHARFWREHRERWAAR